MADVKNNPPKLFGKEGHNSDRPIMAASGAIRQSPHQDESSVRDISEKILATAEDTTKTLEHTYSSMARGAADVQREWLEMMRINTHANLDFLHALIQVKSPLEFFELSSAHARKQFETFAKHAQHVVGLAQKATSGMRQTVHPGLTTALNAA